MKILLVMMLMLNICYAQSMSCGQTKTSTTLEKKELDVVTEVPNHLKGARIILVKADGSQETLKAEDFMVVKRKHKRPIFEEKTVSSRLECQNNGVKNIVSLKAVNSYGSPDRTIHGNSGTVSVSRSSTLGAQYQRNIGKNLYLGVEGDLNQNAGLMIGLGF